MTKLIAFSGRKQSGKTSSFNYLFGIEMLRTHIVRDNFRLDEEGRILVTDIFGNTDYAGIFDPFRRNDTMKTFLKENIDPFIKGYSFADELKEFCINVLGLTEQQCYGTNEEKNTLTGIKWEDIPGIVTHKSGFMTGREVMEVFGTHIVRQMKKDAWTSSCSRKIQKDNSDLAIIVDVRFPNEVEAVKNAGGKVIRLMRTPFPEDTSPVETSLDQDNYDWANFDAVIDNREITQDEKSAILQSILEEWGYVEKMG